MAESMKDLRRPAKKELRKAQNFGDLEMITNFLNTSDGMNKSNSGKENQDTVDEDSEDNESDDGGIEDFYIASRKVTNQVEEERDALKLELRMMMDQGDLLTDELESEKREKALIQFTISSFQKERDNLKEKLTSIKFERENVKNADKTDIPVIESSLKQTIHPLSRRKSAGSKRDSTESQIEVKGSRAKTDPENSMMAGNKRVDGDEKSFIKRSIVTGSAVKKTRTCSKFGDSCMGCTTPECDVCIYCLDRPSRGGQLKLKQKCLKRRCWSDSITDPVLKEPVVAVSVELSCDKCSQDFRRKEQLKRHKLMTHGA